MQSIICFVLLAVSLFFGGCFADSDGDDDKDYSFKVGMSYYGTPSQSEIVDFLLENNR